MYSSSLMNASVLWPSYTTRHPLQNTDKCPLRLLGSGSLFIFGQTKVIRVYYQFLCWFFLIALSTKKWCLIKKRALLLDPRILQIICNILIQFCVLKTSLIFNSSVIRQKGESQNGSFKKKNLSKFSEKGTFLTPWYAHVRVRIREWETFVFRKIWFALFSWNTRLEIRPFALLPTNSELFFNAVFLWKIGIWLDTTGHTLPKVILLDNIFLW